MSSTVRTEVITTGLNGLVGSKLAQLLAAKYDFINLDITHPTQPVDITNITQVTSTISSHTQANSVVHLAAFTDVTRAWDERGDKSGLAYKVNVEGTRNIIKACEATNKHLIHISTAFVFDGNKEGLYTEADPMNPIEWYGQTKAWAEEAVMAAQCPWTILRIDFPFRSDPFLKPDIVRKLISSAEKGYPIFHNHWFGPTFIDDFVRVIDLVLTRKTTGLFHSNNGEKWSDFELITALNELHHLQLEPKRGDVHDYLKTLQRPYQLNTAMDSTKLQTQLQFSFTPIREALTQVEVTSS